jgi:predicted RNase H-like nuclease (RuvC/YqgF family)
LLTNASLDAQNYLDLEEKLKVLEANLTIANENLAKLKSEVELKEEIKETELKDYEETIDKLENKIATSKELIFNLQKEIRELNLYHQRNLRANSKEVKEQLVLLNSSITDQTRELEIKKELEFASSKLKQLNPLFNQVLEVIKKNIILREKSKLKVAIANIQEIME